MDENKVIVKENQEDTMYKVVGATLMFIGVVATGNAIVSGGKKFTNMIKNKIIKFSKKRSDKEEA